MKHKMKENKNQKLHSQKIGLDLSLQKVQEVLPKPLKFKKIFYFVLFFSEGNNGLFHKPFTRKKVRTDLKGLLGN